MVDKYHFIITNLDAHTIDLEPFQYSGANITTLRLIDTSSAPVSEYAEYMTKKAKEEAEKPPEDGEPNEDNPDDRSPDDECRSCNRGDGEEDGENPEDESSEPPENAEEAEEEDGLMKLETDLIQFLCYSNSFSDRIQR